VPWTVPVALEDALYAAARDVVGDEPLATGPLVRAIVDRSRRYTSERDRLARPADPRGDLAARAVFFTVADAMKIAIPLAELANRGAIPASRPLRVVDLGAGCGAMTLGLLATLGERDLAIVTIDRDAEALRIAAAAAKAFAGVSLATRCEDVGRAALPVADLIVAGSVLNELPAAAALALVERALAALADDGALILVEPALRETTRGLHVIRDAVIASGAAHVFAPCTRHGVPCPMLADPSDWCHEDRALELPPRTRELAKLTHLRDSGMKFSYLVLRKRPLDLVAAGERAWRIVSAPIIAKGKRELHGCNAGGLVTLRLLKRHRSDANRAFEDADRGDVLVIDAPDDDRRVEVRGDTVVMIARG
jgi:ribosomal protein RSM22 (predicted rRNA methylase)